MVDDRDPAAHWAMGRALWLRRDQDQSIVELEKAIDLSPNFALGHYTLAFVQSQAGDARAAIKSSDYSRQLSPFDPLLFGMLGARAMALVRLGRFDEAADWAIKAAARPNAHAHILAIAAYSLALAGRRDEARGYLAAIHKALPHYRVDDFPHRDAFFAAGWGAVPQGRQAHRIGGVKRYSARRVDHRTHPRIEMPGVILPVHWVKCASARAFLNSAFRASEMPWFGPTSK